MRQRFRFAATSFALVLALSPTFAGQRSGRHAPRHVYIADASGSLAPSGTADSETVDVKYRGLVNLAPFKCNQVTRSSFIRRVCYDEKNNYMLIQLKDTWYHYCEIDPVTVSGLLAAPSMRRFYNASIKGSWTLLRTGRRAAFLIPF